MKNKYYVNDNAQPNGDHEVHVEGCKNMPSIQNRTSLGECTSCAEAVLKAKTRHKQVNGCYHCCNECHTT